METRRCETCGKGVVGLPWETRCWSCREEERRKTLTQLVLSGECITPSDDTYAVCPWCGGMREPDCDEEWGYSEGFRNMECEDCGKGFTVATSVSYYYETQRKEG
jgi:hypothetical protein